MAALETTCASIQTQDDRLFVDEAQLAAAAFLAGYSGRTLDGYQHDVRMFFGWARQQGFDVLRARRPHIELYRSAMEERGLAPATIDRRLSTVCGFYRFAPIDGRSRPTRRSTSPAQGAAQGRARHGPGRARHVPVHRGPFDRDHAALAVLLGLNGLRVSEACATNVEDLGFQRGQRTLAIVCKGNKPATVSAHASGSARTIDLARRRTGHQGPILCPRDGRRRTVPPRTGGCQRSTSEPGSTGSTHTCSWPNSLWPPLMPARLSVTHRSPPATPTRNDHDLRPPSGELHRHAAYVVLAFVARRLTASPSALKRC